MPIVADSTTPAELPQEVFQKADEMRALLKADLFEEDKARRVAEFDVGTLEFQLVVWEVLTSFERRAWKEYFGIGYGMRSSQD